MKNFYLILIIFLGVLGVNGQERFKVEPSPCILNFPIPDPDGITDHYCESKVKNVINSTLHILWKREDLQIPQDWTGYICDNNFCYAPGAYKCPDDIPNNIAPGKSCNIDVHVNTNDVDGSAHIVVYVFEKEDTAKKIKVDFLFNKVTSNKDVKNIAIKVYPNPAENAFTVEYNTGINRLELVSVLGKKVAEYKTTPNNSYDISMFDDGMYFLKMIGTDDKVIKTIRMQKRSLRP